MSAGHSRRRTGATGFVAPWAGSIAHQHGFASCPTVGDAHPTNSLTRTLLFSRMHQLGGAGERRRAEAFLYPVADGVEPDVFFILRFAEQIRLARLGVVETADAETQQAHAERRKREI